MVRSTLYVVTAEASNLWETKTLFMNGYTTRRSARAEINCLISMYIDYALPVDVKISVTRQRTYLGYTTEEECFECTITKNAEQLLFGEDSL